MTALTIITKAVRRLGITAPTAVFSSTDDQVIQLRELMNEEGQELARAYPWKVLTTEQTFTTVAQAVQTSAVPSDFDWYINDTMWNRSTDIKIAGPVSPEEWQKMQALSSATLPNTVFRFRGSDILFYPSPTAGQTAAYEYVSKNWAQTSGGSGLSAMTADTDTAKLDEALVALGVTWRFLQAKGLDYAESFRTYQMEVGKAIGRDGGRKRIYLGGSGPNPWRGNIQEGNWTL